MPTVSQAARTDSGLASELRVSVARLSRRLRSEKDPGITVSQRSVLGLLYRYGDLTVGQLAEADRVQPPSMTRTVTALADAGYVCREPDENDKRQVRVRLTDLGEETVLADRRRRDAWLAQRLRELTPEERDLLRRAAPVIDKLASE